MFKPKRCPNPSCSAHQIRPGEERKFYVRRGYYKPKCRRRRVPRFRCIECNRGFSGQTFRADYRDHKPHVNAKLFELLSSGVGLRPSARIVKLSRRCAAMKARKMARFAADRREEMGRERTRRPREAASR